MLTPITLKISNIYIPSERRTEINLKEVEELAEQMIDETVLKPIKVRKGKDRYVLISGINKLEAHKALGEDTIEAIVVKARQF
ncbi:MAG: ParB N-terminal domain-containing protein [Proteobacteria bacterium]|nr:ParB N-terminal domain-containing protein [Pseudomonadota bacterium]